MKTLERFDAVSFLSVDEKVLLNWLQLVESNYHADNPYHNSTHAADVMHATAYFLTCDKLKVVTHSLTVRLAVSVSVAFYTRYTFHGMLAYIRVHPGTN